MPYASRYPSSVVARTKRFRRGKVSKYRRGTNRYLTLADIPRLLKSTQIVNHEMKFYDTTISYALGGIGFMNQANFIVPVIQGTSAVNRTGREILVEKVEFNLVWWTINAVAASAGQGDIGRAVVIMDTECAGTASAPNPATVWSGNTYITGFYNPDSFTRFKPFGDTMVTIEPHTNNTGGQNIARMHKTVKINRRVHYYNASNTGTSTDCERNGLWIQFGTQNTLAAVAGYVRVYFRDV